MFGLRIWLKLRGVTRDLFLLFHSASIIGMNEFNCNSIGMIFPFFFVVVHFIIFLCANYFYYCKTQWHQHHQCNCKRYCPLVTFWCCRTRRNNLNACATRSLAQYSNKKTSRRRHCLSAEQLPTDNLSFICRIKTLENITNSFFLFLLSTFPLAMPFVGGRNNEETIAILFFSFLTLDVFFSIWFLQKHN